MTLANHDYERAVLGSLIWDNSRTESVQVRDEWFSNSRYRAIWQAAREIMASGRVAGVVNTAERAKVSPEDVSECVEAETVAWREYCERLAELARLRRLRALGQELQWRSESEASDTVTEYAESELLRLADEGGGDYEHIVTALDDAVNDIQAASERGGALSGVTTGLPTLDYLTDGLQPGEMIVLGARPGVGKTAIALHMVRAAAEAGHGCGFFSLEMSARVLGKRLLSASSGVEGRKLRSGMLAKSDFGRLVDAAGKLGDLPIWVVDTPNMGLHDIVTQARRMRRREGAGLIVVDYVGLVHHDSRDMPRHEQVREISSRLKSLARELSVPVLALSQVTRDMHGKRPTLASLRESGALEQDADAVILLHPNDSNQTEVILAKQRNGPVGEVATSFDAASMRFYEVDRRHE